MSQSHHSRSTVTHTFPLPTDLREQLAVTLQPPTNHSFAEDVKEGAVTGNPPPCDAQNYWRGNLRLQLRGEEIRSYAVGSHGNTTHRNFLLSGAPVQTFEVIKIGPMCTLDQAQGFGVLAAFQEMLEGALRHAQKCRQDFERVLTGKLSFSTWLEQLSAVPIIVITSKSKPVVVNFHSFPDMVCDQDLRKLRDEKKLTDQEFDAWCEFYKAVTGSVYTFVNSDNNFALDIHTPVDSAWAPRLKGLLLTGACHVMLFRLNLPNLFHAAHFAVLKLTRDLVDPYLWLHLARDQLYHGSEQAFPRTLARAMADEILGQGRTTKYRKKDTYLSDGLTLVFVGILAGPEAAAVDLLRFIAAYAHLRYPHPATKLLATGMDTLQQFLIFRACFDWEQLSTMMTQLFTGTAMFATLRTVGNFLSPRPAIADRHQPAAITVSEQTENTTPTPREPTPLGWLGSCVAALFSSPREEENETVEEIARGICGSH